MSKGFGLLLFIFITAVALILGAFLMRLLISEIPCVSAELHLAKSFYLAEAGIEKAKWELSKDLNWHTDARHFPEDDLPWLVRCARGHIEAFGDGYFKIIKEEGKNVIYALGISKKALAIIRVKYEIPFRQVEWKLL